MTSVQSIADHDEPVRKGGGQMKSAVDAIGGAVARRVSRVYLGHLDNGPVEPVLPIHGYVIEVGDDVILVDTGIGSTAMDAMQSYSADWKMTVRSLDGALDDHGLSIADVTAIVSSHLHLDHYGQHLAVKGVPFIVQRTELARARAHTAELPRFFDFAGAVIHELDGDEVIADGVQVLATPGHTVGHQSVLVTHDDSTTDLLVGDAAYTVAIWERPEIMDEGHPAYHMQVGDPTNWRATLDRLRSLAATRLHFCHDATVLETPAGG